MIAIVDYGMGNLKSVQKALAYLNISSFISNKKEEILNSTGIIIPGVGAFPDAMENMKTDGLDMFLIDQAQKGKPVLGICLGMQLLFEDSEEMITTKGLGLLSGSITQIPNSVKVPHMGWNSLKLREDSPLINGVKEGDFVYFVHSYFAKPAEKSIVNAYAEYGLEIPAIVSKDNIFGIQFHPEKSGEAGMRILKNFGELVK